MSEGQEPRSRAHSLLESQRRDTWSDVAPDVRGAVQSHVGARVLLCVEAVAVMLWSRGEGGTLVTSCAPCPHSTDRPQDAISGAALTSRVTLTCAHGEGPGCGRAVARQPEGWGWRHRGGDVREEVTVAAARLSKATSPSSQVCAPRGSPW